MIKINLAKGKGAVGAESASAGLGQLQAYVDLLKDLPIQKPAAYLLVTFLVSVVMNFYTESLMKDTQDLLSKIQDSQTPLKEELAKSKAYEDKKKALDVDEKLIDTKIQVINELTADRGAALRLILDLMGNVPKEIWITEFKLEKKFVSLKGNSVGSNPISELMKAMTLMDKLVDLVPKPSEVKKDETGMEVDTFELVAKLR